MRKFSSVKRIITMTNEWFTNEKYERNCIDMILDAGYEAEIWNVNKIIFREEVIPDVPDDLYRGDVPVKNFETRDELRKELQKYRADSLILNWYAASSATWDICVEKVRYCNMYGAPMLAAPYIEALSAYYEVDENYRDKKNNILRDLRQKLGCFKLNSEQRTIKKWSPIRNFAATPAEYVPIYRLAPRDRLKFIHAIDYDKYLLDKNRMPKDEGYILFIDEAWITHPENKSLGWIFTKEEAEHYYNLMDKLFTCLEEYYNKKVIIAAHPKAEYSGNEFNHREIRQFQTYELIKNSSFVVQHGSTVMNWIVMFDKPCLFISYSKMDEYMVNLISLFQSYFDCKYFDLEYDRNPWDFVYHDKQIYQKYFHDFVAVDKSDTRLYMEVVLDEINILRS